jgi:2-phospho-L-lactate guanylyltransferase
MRTLAVLPIKSFGAAKQRLSEALGSGSRHLLAQAMCSDVLAALRRARRVDAVVVVTDDHEVEALFRGEPVTVLEDDVRAGQSPATVIGIEHALANGYERALLVPGDTPLARADDVDSLLDTARAEQLAVAIVADRHGAGTNALVITPPGAFEPSFGPESLERHLGAARKAGLAHRVVEVEALAHDVDTPDDLSALTEVLDRRRGVAPRTRGALRQFDRLHLRPPASGNRAPAAAGASPVEPAGAAPDVVLPRRREGAAEQSPAAA